MPFLYIALAINNVPNTVHIITNAAEKPVNNFNKIGMAIAKIAILGYFVAKFPKVAPKIAALAYFVSPSTINAGSTDKTAPPIITAEVVAIKLVIIEPQIAMVDTISARIVPG